LGSTVVAEEEGEPQAWEGRAVFDDVEGMEEFVDAIRGGFETHPTLAHTKAVVAEGGGGRWVGGRGTEGGKGGVN